MCPGCDQTRARFLGEQRENEVERLYEIDMLQIEGFYSRDLVEGRIVWLGYSYEKNRK